MQKTTAKVEYRGSVNFSFNITFCDVDFYGFRAEGMKRKWRVIKNKQYDKYNSLYCENEVKIKSLRTQANAISKRVEKSRPFYRFFYNKSEKEMLAEAQRLSSEADKLEKENKKVNEKKFFDPYQFRTEIENFLQQNGFILTHTSSSNEACINRLIITEVWTREE